MRHLKYILIFIMIGLVFNNVRSMAVFGLADGLVEMQNVNFNISCNGGTANIEKNDSQYIVNFNTHEVDEGYYTAYLYELGGGDWSKYSGLCFTLKNYSGNESNININIKTKDGILYTIKDNNFIFAKEYNSSYIMKINQESGTVHLKKNFDGIIYIPFNLLKKKSDDNNSTADLSSIDSWGIIITSKEEEDTCITVGNFSFIDMNSTLSSDLNCPYSVKGDSEVMIPIAGESIADFNIVDSNTSPELTRKDIKTEYHINGIYKGITINNDGRMTIHPEAQEDEVDAYVILNDKIREDFKVRIFKSWTLSAKEVDGTSKSIPTDSEVSSVINSEISFLRDYKSINIIRIGTIIVIFGIVMFYLIWKSHRRI